MKRFLALFLLAFLILSITEITQIQPVKANPHAPASVPAELIPRTITIKWDGRIDPPTSLISKQNNVYTFTEDLIDYSIRVDYSGAVIDGAGHQLKANKNQYYAGITLNSTLYVTVKDLQINGFQVGVMIQRQLWEPPIHYSDRPDPPNPYPPSKNNTIIDCKIIDNVQKGVSMQSTSSNAIIRSIISGSQVGIGLSYYGVSASDIENNTLTNNGLGIDMSNTPNSTVTGNVIAKNGIGILAEASTNNKISNNLIAQNSDWALCLNSTQKNNQIFGNNFVDNNQKVGFQILIPWYIAVIEENGQLKEITGTGMGNVWICDSRGNFWSDFKTRYPNAREINGIWDTPFYINENNIDQYPLVNPLPNIALSAPQQEVNAIAPASFPIAYTALTAVLAIAIFSSLMVHWRISKRRKKNPVNQEI